MFRHYWFVILLFAIVFYKIDFSCFVKECDTNLEMPSFVSIPIFQYIREKCITFVNTSFPSPHSELLLGMTVGLDLLSAVPGFKAGLKNTGTIHVVGVSGFNISLVFNSVIKLIGSKYKLRNVLIAQCMTFVYAVLTGFEPPVVRALVMGSIISWGKYYGRGMDTLLVLITSALVMIIIQPMYFFNLSFRLSFMATLGLILFSNIIAKLLRNPEFVLAEDFIAGVSAQLLVWPILSYYFGTVSIISLLVNTLILWTVSFTTIFGSLFLLMSFISIFLSSLFLIPLYVLLEIFVKSVEFFNTFSWGYFEFKLSLSYLILYYLVLVVLLIKVNKSK